MHLLRQVPNVLSEFWTVARYVFDAHMGTLVIIAISLQCSREQRLWRQSVWHTYVSIRHSACMNTFWRDIYDTRTGWIVFHEVRSRDR